MTESIDGQKKIIYIYVYIYIYIYIYVYINVVCIYKVDQ